MYVCIELVLCTDTTCLQQSNMDQPLRMPNLLVVSWTEKLTKCPCRCIRCKYINMYYGLHLFIDRKYFLFGDTYIRAQFTAVYACMCDYSGMYAVISSEFPSPQIWPKWAQKRWVITGGSFFFLRSLFFLWVNPGGIFICKKNARPRGDT